MKEKRTRFTKLLVANRGEIAIRILRAGSELKLRTVAIYTYEDRYSLHRYKADEAYQIGEQDEPLKPYLYIEKIIQVAKKNEVDAIHPGYGFLSENVQFARRCREEGIIFIGPAPEVMDKLGDKVAAKKIASAVNVPIIEDSKKKLTSEEIILEEAKRIGFPIMVKAAAGGGGKGMKVAHTKANLQHAIDITKAESKAAFGDDTIFLEKLLEHPRHIEFQVIADNFGNVVCLGDRDCSMQRSHQKVVEEAPAPGIPKEKREEMIDKCISFCQHIGYQNAGTLEFLYQDGEFYFIEMTTNIIIAKIDIIFLETIH